MNDSKKASFSFKYYRIAKFSYNHPNSETEDLLIQFDPHGLYNSDSREFELTIQFRAFIELEPTVDIINVEMKAFFTIESNKSTDPIPEYFYRNSIAIVFPYLRAFVSTLTFQANLKPVILPIMNLSGLEEPFRNQTKII